MECARVCRYCAWAALLQSARTNSAEAVAQLRSHFLRHVSWRNSFCTRLLNNLHTLFTLGSVNFKTHDEFDNFSSVDTVYSETRLKYLNPNRYLQMRLIINRGFSFIQSRHLTYAVITLHEQFFVVYRTLGDHKNQKLISGFVSQPLRHRSDTLPTEFVHSFIARKNVQILQNISSSSSSSKLL